jgi:AraC-like DNA-binding protein
MSRHEPYIQGIAMMGLREYIIGKEGDADAIFRAAGLTLLDYDRPDIVISYRSINILLDEAATRLGLPCFGAQSVFEMPKHVPFVAQFVLLSKFEKNCRDWIHSTQRYLAIHTNGFKIELIQTENHPTSRLRYLTDALTSLSKQLASTVLAKAVVATRQATGLSDLCPSCVYFRHMGSNAEQETYAKLFGCPIKFNSEHDEIEFENYILDLPTLGHLGLFKSVMNFYVRWRISRLEETHHSHTTMASLAIASTLGSGHCNIAHVASTLGWNTKQLQRLLQTEDTSFSDILNDVRKNTAIALLKDSIIPVGKIASMLDYAGSPPFNLAFRRWSDQSPHEFRKRSQENLT